ncbi:MAG TPA: histidine phosphatase family protein [Nocardioidaceae bacterium]|nr:histidine phosphatase family protein [Nocardioidaceae bacterium]
MTPTASTGGAGSSGGRLFLVRHGKPSVQPGLAPDQWQLDPAGHPAIESLRESGRLPAYARWFSSPEPKALDTARLLTDAEITVVADLREHERGPTPWFDDLAEWRALVRRVFAEPDRPAYPGWEPLRATRDRVVPAVRAILAAHPGEDVVLAGHGTAWTALRAELTDSPPDLDAWDALEMPDVWVLPSDVIAGGRDHSRFG